VACGGNRELKAKKEREREREREREFNWYMHGYS